MGLATTLNSGVTEPVIARLATEHEKAEVWAIAKSIYTGFAHHEDRVPHREVRVLFSNLVGDSTFRRASE